MSLAVMHGEREASSTVTFPTTERGRPLAGTN